MAAGIVGLTAEQDLVVRGHYGAKLAVINIGGTYTTGPTEAAHVINEMVKPASVIPSHANEVATEGGKLIGGTKTDIFIKALKLPAHLPLGGRTMEFDSGGEMRRGLLAAKIA